MGCVRHIIPTRGMWEVGNAYKALVRNLNGRDHLEDGHTLKDNIKIYLAATGGRGGEIDLCGSG
jgi:hypothetical protein